jgi:anti-sigma regulatory factor (Ser/Thr protein kinase)
MLRPSTRLPVQERSQVGEARRTVQRVAKSAGLTEEASSNAAIVVTELANNLILHGGGGDIVLRCEEGAVELLAIDKGPGMDLVRCLRDGHSSLGTPGNGLGAVKRLSMQFDAHSSSQGSVLWARIGAAPAPGELQFGVVCLPLAGETLCGDDWVVRATPASWFAMLVDGLGHGPFAATAAQAATLEAIDEAPALALAGAHRCMSGTRGGTGACVRIDREQNVLSYASVGNICLTLVDGGVSRGLPAQNGTLGAHYPSRVIETLLPMHAGALLIMHSDGVATRWSLGAYAGLASRHPAVIAGVLLRDFRRERDDATVLVVRCPAESSHE